MSKYSDKIKEFIYDEVHNDIRDPSLPVPLIEKSRTLKMINDAIRESQLNNANPVYDVETSLKMAKMHLINDPPFMYMFFDMLLRETDDIMRSESERVPMIDNIQEFNEWYRRQAANISFEKIRRFVLARSHQDKDDPLVTIYKLMYHTSGARSILHKIYDNPFVSLDVQHDIESKDLLYQKIRIDLTSGSQLTNSHVDLHLFQSDPEKDTESKKIDLDLVAHIVRTMAILHNKSRFTDISTLELTIILSDQKKMFDNAEFLAADNINSGSTWPGRTVTVWRAEEIYKVLIHELIHFYGFDFGSNHPTYQELDENLSGTIEFEGSDAINETYTETLAILINSLFHANYATDFGNIEQIQSSFEESIILERGFLMWQVAKIVNIYGGKSMESLLNGGIRLVQTTSVRSYFVFKLFMMFNLVEFVEFIDDGGETCGLNICDRLIEYGKLIVNSYEKFGSYTKIIQQIDDNISKLDSMFKQVESGDESIDNRPKWVYRTGRMSATEITK